MMTKPRYTIDDLKLDAAAFVNLANRVWPGAYDAARVQSALNKTINITAWDGEKLVGSVRILSDGYFFGTVPELLVDPDYQGIGIGRRLMELAWDHSPTSLYFGAQPGKEPFYEELGFTRSLQSYERKKPRE